MSISVSVMKTNPSTYKIKYSKQKKMKDESYLLLTNLKISYYWVADKHFRDKRKVILDLPSYAIKKEVNDASNAEQPIYLLK